MSQLRDWYAPWFRLNDALATTVARLSVEQLVPALHSTFAIIERCLDTWTPESRAATRRSVNRACPTN